MMSSSTERDYDIEMAKLAEQAERYEDMAKVGMPPNAAHFPLHAGCHESVINNDGPGVNTVFYSHLVQCCAI